MFNWFRRQQPEKAVEPVKEKRSSLFTTQIDETIVMNRTWEELLRRSIRILPSQLKPVNNQGLTTTAAVKPILPGGFAMDDAQGGTGLTAGAAQPFEYMPYSQISWYANQTFIGYQLCAIIGQHWFVHKICRMPGRDAIRHGYEIASQDDEALNDEVIPLIKKLDKKFRIKSQCVEFIHFNRLFGIRIALPVIETDDPDYYLKPFDIENVEPKSYIGITQIDPYWITPELDAAAAADPASTHFYEPTWWRVNGKRIHRTHLIIIRNGEVADVLKPTYYYGGIPLPQMIAERVFAAERTANEAPQLAMTKRTTVMKTDVTQAISNFTEFLKTISFFTRTRDNYGLKVVGSDDDIQQYDTSLAEFSDVTAQQFQLACAAGEVTASKMMGDSPKGGLGSNGDYEQGDYREFLESIQENDMQPLIDRHHELLMASWVRPILGSKVPKDWEPMIIWNSTESLTYKAKAEINEIKSRVGNNLVNSGAVDGVDERNRLKADEDSGYNNLGDREPEVEDLSEEQDTTGGIKSDKTEAGEKD